MASTRYEIKPGDDRRAGIAFVMDLDAVTRVELPYLRS